MRAASSACGLSSSGKRNECRREEKAAVYFRSTVPTTKIKALKNESNEMQIAMRK
jgi:hypothetical protein